jgi:hypothetical protein
MKREAHKHFRCALRVSPFMQNGNDFIKILQQTPSSARLVAIKIGLFAASGSTWTETSEHHEFFGCVFASFTSFAGNAVILPIHPEAARSNDSIQAHPGAEPTMRLRFPLHRQIIQKNQQADVRKMSLRITPTS